ncbi:MAG: hypothetical protein M1823_001768 [Watsoniomyces obsoletus]|nr:MAG: hypothetical protein M1823_001768 [Watsoniomyces obsoletus]
MAKEKRKAQPDDEKARKSQNINVTYDWDEPASIRQRFFRTMGKILQNKIKTKQTTIKYKDISTEAVGKQKKYTKEETSDMENKIKEVYNEDVVVLSEEGERLCVFLANGLERPWEYKRSPVECTEAAIRNLIKMYPPPPPSPKDIRHTSFKELQEKYGKDCGLYHFTLWIPQGHEHTETSKRSLNKGGVISQNVIGGCEKFNQVIQFYKATAPLTQTIGILFQAIDPVTYKRYQTNFQTMSRYSALSSLHYSSRDCFLGRVLLRNLVAEPHKDALDTRTGWVAICCFGNFTGGDLVVPDLGVRLQLRPGGVVFLRSALFVHFLTDFKGERTSMVFFSHESLNKGNEDITPTEE